MLPNFLVIGAQKAGTTALHQYLRSHPQVFVSRPKELRFFVAEANWGRGLAWYESHFEAAGDRPARGESSPDYARATVHPGVPERIAGVLPDVRLVYLVRHPLERIRSAYQHAVAHGVERRPIDEAVLAEPSYVDDSRYRFQLDRHLEHCDVDRILVIDNADLRRDRATTLARVAGFLSVDGAAWDWERVGRDVYTSEGRRAPNAAATALRGAAWAEPLRRLVPTRARQVLHRSASRPIQDEELRMAPGTAARLWDRLAEDVEGLVPWVPAAASWSPEESQA